MGETASIGETNGAIAVDSSFLLSASAGIDVCAAVIWIGCKGF